MIRDIDDVIDMASRRREMGFVSLLMPELEPFYHPSRNRDLKFTDIRIHDVVQWYCHSEPRCNWSEKCQAKIIGRNVECPVCRKRNPETGKSAADLFPFLIDEWSPKNEWSPTELRPFSGYRVLIDCPLCGKEFNCTVQQRTGQNKRCPYCNNGLVKPVPSTKKIKKLAGTHKVTQEYNLGVCSPEVAAEWHPTENGDWTPFDVPPRSSKKAAFLCSKGHTYWATIAHRTGPPGKGRTGSGCPKCASNSHLWVSFREAREWARASDLTRRKHWTLACKEGAIPENIPRAPHETYKDEWLGVRDFLCGEEHNKPKEILHRLAALFNIWDKKKWPYETSGKREVGDMIQTELDHLGYYDLNFLSLPGNGREIKKLIDGGFDFNYDDCLGVERYKAKALREFLKRLFQRGELGGIIPVVSDDVDRVLTDGRLLPEFNAIHLDYNGPLTMPHVIAAETALTNNPDAIVAVTVQSKNVHGLRIDYNAGDFPFLQADPELLFFQPYAGVKKCPMETYCFIGG